MIIRIAIALLLFLALPLRAGDLFPATKPTSIYQPLVDQYLAGDWDTLETSLASHPKEIADLPQDQAADIAYIRRALAECHPVWLSQAKAGNKVVIHPNIWSHTLNMTYDPSIKNNILMQSTNNQMSLSVNWPASDMENPAHAEHGFSKGELASFGNWSILGSADVWQQTTPARINGLSGNQRTLFQRYQDFRGCVTGIYYATPRGRCWGCFLSLDAFGDHYATAPAFIPRKPVGAALLAEIASNPQRYPTFHLPARIPDSKIEQRLAASLMNQFARPITLAEDQALRELIKALATANGPSVYSSGRVTLANKITVALDPMQDVRTGEKRNEWLHNVLAPASTPPATDPAIQQ